MKFLKIIPLLFITLLLPACSMKIQGDLQQWHTVTLTFNGPRTSEYAADNPFLNYRLNVTFTNGIDTFIVPGYFTADGNASESGAVSGNKWRVHFTPNAIGKWSYSVSFRKGKDIAVSDNELDGRPVEFDGETGTFTITPSDKKGRDFRAKGRLQYMGERYLQFAGTHEYFLKGGADSPENFLAYQDFDDTYSLRTEQRDGEARSVQPKTYQAHIRDWKPGDPTWQGNKGKGIIGALNYLAGKGMNSVYFLTMNIQGDGNDVWPWINEYERTRFDCSKLDQWEIVFNHMEKLGIMMHLVTQETENELLLDIGQTQIMRKLYYRELVARFGHHLAMTWNLGEENGVTDWSPKGQTDDDRKTMAKYLKQLIPYNSFIVVHTHSDERHQELYLTPLLGFKYLDGPSMQIADPRNVHRLTNKWIEASGKAGKQWVVNLDEIGPADTGAKPDSADPDHDLIRNKVLWGNLMAGGGGVEWYFGYKYPNNDLNCQNWRSRDLLWDQTRIALDFFHQYLPFQQMKSADNLTSRQDDYVLAKPGEIYAIYIPNNGFNQLNTGNTKTDYAVKWYNPRTGGGLVNGNITTVHGPGKAVLGNPPSEPGNDWVVLVKKIIQ